MPNIRWLLALITAIHRWIYRVSGGRIGGRLGRRDMLLLETVGRKTGQQRTTPLLYVPDGSRFVVVASNAGDDRDPAWWLNLKQRPETTIQVGTQSHRVRARRASEEETQQLWPLLEASYGPYAQYRTRTARSIPVILLEPAS